MQITKLLQTPSFNSLITVTLVTMVLVFFNDPDPDLEKRVSDLEKRVDLIEETLSGTDKVETSEKGQPNRENWRKLREGMSKDKVQELLGKPDRIDGGSLAVWHYPNGGTVHFYRGKVHRWSEPY